MADEDLTDFIDVEAFAQLLATPAFAVEPCRAWIAAYVRDGDGAAGRGIATLTEALKAYAGDRLDKPALIARLTCTQRGAFSASVAHRSFGLLGYPIWHHSPATHLLATNPFAILELMAALAPHAEGELDRVLHDLVSWVELGDHPARGRLAPVVERAAPQSLGETGDSTAIGARLLDVLAMPVSGTEAKIACLYANLAAKVSPPAGMFRAFAALLEELDGPCDAPAFEGTGASFEVFWRLARRYRHLLDRFPKVLAQHVGSDEALQLLGIVDEAAELPSVGARGQRWRIMRAGRLVMTTTGEALTYLPRLTVSAAASEAAARKRFAKKLEDKA